MPRSPDPAIPLSCVVALCFAAAGCGNDEPETSERPPAPPVIVYAARDADTMTALFDVYTDETGVTVLVTTESGRSLIDRLSAEKHRATADLIITDSVGHLWAAVEDDILRPSRSEILGSNIPERLRDPDKLWYALLVFGRTIAYDTREIDLRKLTNYAGLGSDQWRGKLCLTSATDVDDQSHIAMMIAEDGEGQTELIVRAWVANLSIPIVTDAANLLQAIEDGQCGLGIVNSDDLARFIRDMPNSIVAGFLPPASSGGAYINIVGAAVTRHAGNPAGALQLLEWLSSEKGQERLAGEDLEVPVSRLDEWSALQVSLISLAEAGNYHEDAEELMERSRWVK